VENADARGIRRRPLGRRASHSAVAESFVTDGEPSLPPLAFDDGDTGRERWVSVEAWEDIETLERTLWESWPRGGGGNGNRPCRRGGERDVVNVGEESKASLAAGMSIEPIWLLTCARKG